MVENNDDDTQPVGGPQSPIGQRLEEAMKAADCSAADLADYCGVSAQAVHSKWITKGQFSKVHYPRITARLKVSLDYLLLGRDSPYVREIEDEPRSPLIYIPKLSIKIEGGTGVEAYEPPEIVDEFGFKRDWIEGKGWPIDRLELMDVIGHSMIHYLRNRDMALVLRDDVEIKDTDDPYENIFAVQHGRGARAKQISWTRDGGSVILRSFNPDKDDYPDEIVAGDEIDTIHIYGRVKWRAG